MSYDYLFKYILLGESQTGKSSFANRLVNDKFVSNRLSTIGIDFFCKRNVIDDNVVIKSHIWDTAGQEKFYSIIVSYYRGIAGAIIMFDIGDRESYERVKYWHGEIIRNRRGIEMPIILLIGNKTDNPNRAVSTSEAEIYAIENNFIYAETSCKDDFNIQNAYSRLVSRTYDKMNKIEPGCGIKRSVPYEKMMSERGGNVCGYIAKRYNRSCCNLL